MIQEMKSREKGRWWCWRWREVKRLAAGRRRRPVERDGRARGQRTKGSQLRLNSDMRVGVVRGTHRFPLLKKPQQNLSLPSDGPLSSHRRSFCLANSKDSTPHSPNHTSPPSPPVRLPCRIKRTSTHTRHRPAPHPPRVNSSNGRSRRSKAPVWKPTQMGRTPRREKGSKGDIGGGRAEVLELRGGSLGGGEGGCWRRGRRKTGGEGWGGS